MATLIGPKTAPASTIAIAYDCDNPRSYPGSGTILYDMAGGHHATLVGPTIANGVATFLGQGERDGDPTGDYISVPRSPTITSNYTTIGANGLSGCTYDIWFKMTGTQPYGQSIYFDAGTIGHIEIRSENTTSAYFRTEARKQNGYNFAIGAATQRTLLQNNFGGLNINEWINLTITFATNETAGALYNPCRWYKNGEFMWEGNMAGGNSGNQEYFAFQALGRATGSSAYLYCESFLGDFSKFTLYNEVLTDEQVENIHNGQRGRFF